MLLAADFVPVTLSSPGPDVTLSVRQVSELSCQSGFLRNLIGLLPAHLHSNLEFCMEDGNKVGSTGAFEILSSRKSPLHTLPKKEVETSWFQDSQASWFLWLLQT